MDINNLIHLAISLVGLVGLLSNFSTHTQNYEGSKKKQLLKFSAKLLISIKIAVIISKYFIYN